MGTMTNPPRVKHTLPEDAKLQWRFVWLGNTADFIEQFRFSLPNGWGPRGWASTPFLAAADFKRALRAG